jgi:hypothetical protein
MNLVQPIQRRENMKRTIRLTSLIALLGFSAPTFATPIHAVLYKNPQCSCCEAYADYLRSNGFDVEIKPTNDLEQINLKAGVPANLEGCHTMFIEGYVVDGLVPVDIVKKLLSEKPAIAGVTLPGMPAGAPGMEAAGAKTGPFTIYAFTKDGPKPTVYATE